MTESNLSFEDTVEVEADGVGYTCEVVAYATYRYWPGTMYRSNGDPGDPPEDDLEITRLEVNDCWETETGQRLLFIDKHIENACEGFLEDMDLDLWSYD